MSTSLPKVDLEILRSLGNPKSLNIGGQEEYS
jgi:hypothetical protein